MDSTANKSCLLGDEYVWKSGLWSTQVFHNYSEMNVLLRYCLPGRGKNFSTYKEGPPMYSGAGIDL